ncbi:hypothetical protein K3495_g4270 [Podosphaera aphanis]|nr:hypothetical protein K3495_g4270 [Podosphaera aphanis]
MANTLSVSDRPSAWLTKRLYQPKPMDVLRTKSIITKKLPIEIVDLIIDLAEYWPHSCVTLASKESDTPIRIPSGGNHENTFLLRSYPIGYVPRACDPVNASSLNESYITTSPSPDPNIHEASQETSDKILSHWAQESQLRGEFPCRKIVFTLKSHDQGWGGDPRNRGTFNGSFTWFDVGKEKLCFCEKDEFCPKESHEQPLSTSQHEQKITNNPTIPYFVIPHPRCTALSEISQDISVLCTSRTIVPKTISEKDGASSTTSEIIKNFEHPLLPDTGVLQKNATADRNARTYTITWSWNDEIDLESAAANELTQQGRGPATASGEFVRSLKFGDIVTIWGKCRFPGWINHVFEVKIDVYWAV